VVISPPDIREGRQKVAKSSLPQLRWFTRQPEWQLRPIKKK
jgi:hypothetical protein